MGAIKMRLNLPVHLEAMSESTAKCRTGARSTPVSKLSWIHQGPSKEALAHLVVCHGFGASAHDLADLAPWLDPQGLFAWHFAQAPNSLQPGSWAWFPSARSALDAAMASSFWLDLESFDSPDIDQSLQFLLDDVDDLVPLDSPLVFAGFSQGAMMALLASLKHPSRGAMLWSGSLLARRRLEGLLAQGCPPDIFMSHGSHDQILPMAGAKALEALLSSRSRVYWHGFTGGHEIDDSAARASMLWLAEILAK